MSLYGVIGDMRREYTTADAARTLDMVVTELGSTRDNLRMAAARLEGKQLPTGGEALLRQLLERARMAGVDDLQRGPAPDEIPQPEELSESDVGIGVLLGASSLLIVLLAVAAVLYAINQAVHFV